MFELFILIQIAVTLGLFAIAIVLLRLAWLSPSYDHFARQCQDLATQWFILRPFLWFIKRITFEPIIPSDRKVQLGLCTIYLARIPFKLSKERLLTEILAYIDLYYQEKRRPFLIQSDNTIIYTAISEEAYIQIQWMFRSKNSLDVTFYKAIQEYLPRIRWTRDVLQSYNPKDHYFYFSMQ